MRASHNLKNKVGSLVIKCLKKIKIPLGLPCDSLSNIEGFIRIRMQIRCFDDNFLIIVHLGVVKVGLLWLAKPEVFCQRIIFTTKKNSTLDNYHPTLTTPMCRFVILEVSTACVILRIFLRTVFWDKLTTPIIHKLF